MSVAFFVLLPLFINERFMLDEITWVKFFKFFVILMKCENPCYFFLKINTLLFYVHIDQGIYRVKYKEAGNEKCLLFIFKKFLGHFIKHRVLISPSNGH